MNVLNITENLIEIVKKAASRDEKELKSLRKMMVGIVDKIGAKNFVTLTADILKRNFCIEGCNDLRMPLKRIFTVSLEELQEDLSKNKFFLPKGHPINLLSEDHKDNIRELEALDFSEYNKVDSYYKELDVHIRKEEEVLFPVLEENGMKEHPDSLRNEHKEFRKMLSEIAESCKQINLKRQSLAFGRVTTFKEKFILDISNHIFRETHIFYPAALEFINEQNQWDRIKKGFDLI